MNKSFTIVVRTGTDVEHRSSFGTTFIFTHNLLRKPNTFEKRSVTLLYLNIKPSPWKGPE